MRVQSTSYCLFAFVLIFLIFFGGLGWAAGRVTYSAKDSPKTHGLDFSVSYPEDYEFVDNLSSPSQLFVAYTNEPEFPTVMGVLLNPAPQSFPPFTFKTFEDEDVTKWVNESLASPGGNPQILTKEKITHKGRAGVKATALVDQVLLDEIQPSIEELLFVTHENFTITMVCSVFNSQKNPNILKHFHDRGGFDACNDFFSSLTLP